MTGGIGLIGLIGRIGRIGSIGSIGLSGFSDRTALQLPTKGYVCPAQWLPGLHAAAAPARE